MMERNWIKSIDINNIELFPLQFVNCDRINENDAVYIFDEVGSGKTISSGIMALDYLENYPDSSVLVITTNSLARAGVSAPEGQFKRDLLEKLPFQILNHDKKVTVVNNHYSNFQVSKKYGLVIIDEAQLFLNTESERTIGLNNNIRADKVIFLTATPIKSGVSDLYTYVKIAENIVSKKLDKDWIDNIKTTGKGWQEILCSQFSIKSPVTRYFKDTISSLKSKEGFVKSQAKRLLPQIWEYKNQEDKDDCMIQHINSINDNNENNENNRFVVFTRFIEKETQKIEKSLIEAGYTKFSTNGVLAHNKTYYVVTGQNANELSMFSGINNLPTILILTYQIAEQGINLPGFNYVINYHISAFPSSLEQRFGRIDRMGKNGSCYSSINMCFLLKTSNFDSNTINFYSAITTYIYSMLSYIPSKNTLLASNIIDSYLQKKTLIDEYINKITELCDSDVEITKTLKHFQKDYDTLFNHETYEDIIEIGIEGEGELIAFCDSYGIYCDINNKFSDLKSILRSDIKKELSVLRSHFANTSTFTQEWFNDFLTLIEDKIFYCKSEYWEKNDWANIDYKNGIAFVDAIDQCAAQIAKNGDYERYRNSFLEKIKLPLLFDKEKSRLNDYFENEFNKNQFNNLFPQNGYALLAEKHFQSHSEKELILANINQLVATLPFFKMCLIYKNFLHELCFNKKGDLYQRYNFNPFSLAMYKITKLDIEISQNFRDLYFVMDEKETYYRFRKFFIIEIKDNFCQASNWYKLAYHYCKEEEFSVDNGREKYSLFKEYIFTDSNNYRTWFKESLYDQLPYRINEKAQSNDYWTKEILKLFY